MNILFVLGNGFDLNLDLKTSYSAFYDYYLEPDPSSKKSSDSNIIKSLKESIKKGPIETWADLELKLGAYCSELKEKDEIIEIYFDLKTNLTEFLVTVENGIDTDGFNCSALYGDLFYPELHLEANKSVKFDEWVKRFGSSAITANVITFNYTKTFETIVESTAQSMSSKGQRRIVLGTVEHIHGLLAENLVFGVNDVDQIDNPDFRKDQDIFEALVKPLHNEELGHMIEQSCQSKIRNASLICIFGCSLGETDKLWWEVIVEALNDNCRLIIFQKDFDLNTMHPIMKSPIKRKIVDRFLELAGVDVDARDEYKQYIDVAINTNIFNYAKKS